MLSPNILYVCGTAFYVYVGHKYKNYESEVSYLLTFAAIYLNDLKLKWSCLNNSKLILKLYSAFISTYIILIAVFFFRNIMFIKKY